MDIIKAITKRGLELKGAIYEANSKDTVLVMLTGICSNVFQNDLLDTTGKLLSKNNISVIVAHAHDSFSCFAYTDYSTGKQKHTGVFNDDFNMVYEDVETWVLKAKELGFKNIILLGHSLGSNKIINYLGNTSDNFIDYFIISCPVDIMHWWKVMPNIDVCFKIAKKWVDEGRGDDIFEPVTISFVVSGTRQAKHQEKSRSCETSFFPHGLLFFCFMFFPPSQQLFLPFLLSVFPCVSH